MVIWKKAKKQFEVSRWVREVGQKESLENLKIEY